MQTKIFIKAENHLFHISIPDENYEFSISCKCCEAFPVKDPHIIRIYLDIGVASFVFSWLQLLEESHDSLIRCAYQHYWFPIGCLKIPPTFETDMPLSMKLDLHVLLPACQTACFIDGWNGILRVKARLLSIFEVYVLVHIL